ncbi:endolytic transglycosylase MltG [Bifidobacterium cuniculi]|uniref:Endolytic murein transglycosylase n=1 Tax=Bifidobacterium cuniculi TaxID=1688 RepID=A0A087B4A4_9BIFI|nr:endolytic transglycosylase MltG [Bifidobacterium cuniculi]KFI65854.1 aminodeoxychorismate lyase [Bifidobacterium cuniculi]
MGDDIHDFFDDDLDSWPEAGDGGGLTPPTPPRSRKEMRLKRKRRKQHRLIKVVVAVVAILLVIGGGIAAVQAVKGWRHAGTADQSIVDDYPGPGSGSVSFTIQQGEGALQIAQHLLDEDVIKSTEAFTSVVSANDMTLYPGTYQLRHQMKASSVAAILSDQGNAKGFLEVRQGERLSTVLENAAQATDQSVSVFTDATKDQKVIDAILPTEANGSFEGWLQPGVYDVAQDKDPQHLLKQMVDARIAQLDELGVPQGEERERILIIASIVEAEVNQDEYYGKVSRVIYNRLDQDMSLGMDSTVAYGFDTTGTQLTNDQLNDESNPYNTRVHKGLPPTPISNPGDEAIEAALHPTDGNWLYFVTTNLETGETKFTDDYDTFEQYVQEYKANDGAN